jgi:universal stress protein A
MYKHILIAVNFTEDDRLIEDRAVKMHEFTQAKLSLIHVIEPLPSIYGGEVYPISEEYMLPEVKLNEKATSMLKPIAEHLNIPAVNIATPSGKVSLEIIAYSDKNNVDLILMGSHGRHGLQLLLGSTANAVLHHAKCDVLTVRVSD